MNGLPLAGKVALVTGGSRGIGAGIARKLAAWGCELFVNYVQRDSAAEALAQELRANGAVVNLVRADVGDADEVAGLFQTVSDHTDHLDIVVDNAAVAVFRRLCEVTPKHWQFVLDSNARATLLLAQGARALMANRGARFISITNGMPERFVEKGGLLAAAKAAAEALVRYLAVELAADGVVVSSVRPGLVDTGVVDRRPDLRDALEAQRRASPWQRVTTVEDCGDVVALLCLPEAGWLSGQIIDVDGGASLWQ